MSDIRTSLPIPTEPWERARSEFLSGLSDEEQDRFKDATLENIFYDASAAQQRHANKSKAWAMHQRLKPFLETMDDYGRALDVFANAQSAILCPLWGSIRVVLQMAQECGKYQEELVDMLSRIGDALPRFRSYQSLFPNHGSLLLALSNSYLDILRFSVDVKKLFLEARNMVVPRLIACRSLWKPFRNRFNAYLTDFRRHQKEVEKHANVAHMIEAKKAREIELRNRELQESQRKASAHAQFLDRLCDLDTEGLHSRLVRRRHPHSGTWIFDQPVFQSWLTDRKSDCFVCYGIPGCGKTMLSCSMIEELRETDRFIGIVTFHYCDYSTPSSLDTSSLLRNLLKQILQSLGPDHELSEQIRNRISQDARRLCNKILAELLLECTAAIPGAFVFIDGMDELPKEEQYAVAAFLTQLIQGSKSVLKVFITSRQEETTVRKLSEVYQHITMTAKNIRQDMMDFVKDEVRDRLQRGHLRIEDPELQEEIIETLVEKGEDMFLWVRFQLDEICESMNDSAIRETLSNLPKSLSETFSRILHRIWNRPGGPKKLELASKVFRWIACARRPMTIEELMEAASVEKTDTSLDPKKIPRNKDWFISTCGSLVVFDREDSTVTLAHHTIRQYLCSPAPNDIAYPASLHFDEEAADIDVGETCIAFLCFSDFETQVTMRRNDIVAPVADTINFTMWNRLPLRSMIPKLLPFWVGTSDLSEKTQQTQVRFLPIQRGKPTDTLIRQYASLGYISNYWAFHTRHLEENATCWSALRNLAFERQLPFDFRVWDAHSETRRSQFLELALLEWSIDHDGIAFLHLLRERLRLAALTSSWIRTDFQPVLNRIPAGAHARTIAAITAFTCDLIEIAHLVPTEAIPVGLFGAIMAACTHDYEVFNDTWKSLIPITVMRGRIYHSSLTNCLSNRSIQEFETMLKLYDSNRLDHGVFPVFSEGDIRKLKRFVAYYSPLNPPSNDFGDEGFESSLLTFLMQVKAPCTALLLLERKFDGNDFCSVLDALELLIARGHYETAVVVLKNRSWDLKSILETLLQYEDESEPALDLLAVSLPRVSRFTTVRLTSWLHVALANKHYRFALGALTVEDDPAFFKVLQNEMPDLYLIVKYAFKKIQEFNTAPEATAWKKSAFLDIFVKILKTEPPDLYLNEDRWREFVQFLSDVVSWKLERAVNALRTPLEPFLTRALCEQTLPRTLVNAATLEKGRIVRELLSWPLLWPLDCLEAAIVAASGRRNPFCKRSLVEYRKLHYPSETLEANNTTESISSVPNEASPGAGALRTITENSRFLEDTSFVLKAVQLAGRV